MNTDKKSKWNDSAIRALRLRLGWSQAEFARRISLEADMVKALEKGEHSPSEKICGDLEVMRRQADQSNDEKRQNSLADRDLNDRL